MSDKPNIVLIMTDQQRADFFASEGFPVDTMPFVDALGAKGTRFDRAYTPMPICSPARSSMLTGRFPKATRVKQNWDMDKFITFGKDLPAVLHEQGYTVNLAGKNHSYAGRDAFDFYGAPYSHTNGPADRATASQRQSDDWLFELDHHVSTTATPFPLENQLCYRIVSDAITCVDQQRDKPFFLWLSLPEPHNPYQAPEPYFSMFSPDQMPGRVAGPQASLARGGKWQWLRTLEEEKRPGYDDDWRRYRAVYAGMLRMIDDQVKRFVDHLDASGRLDDTIIIFLADHGDYAGDYGLQRKGAGLPECLVRVPFMVTGPGIRSHHNRLDFVSLVDILPTVCEIAGAEIPFGCQGRSLWPMLTGADYPAAEFSSIYAELGFGSLPYGPHERPPLHFDYAGPTYDELNSVTQSGNLKMVRKGNWKLIFDVLSGGELYDLDSDPGELENLYHDPRHAVMRTAMLEELLYWTIRTEDPLPLAKYLPKVAPHNWYRS
ncbi:MULTISPECIES: sulfatase-like hydrolase/transferase [unclassified Devosia]|uniref:sulfatase family protein n=1 Tax=unclassified Devosia TaxID=196773 RepID=UPI000AF87876|nr:MULTISPECIES: sulfatase-like hydrolase/transferase [unclassified Devosia]MBN9306616.1 sulfatase-like hydrolase/transferase [Devosia sp.]